MNWFKTKIRYEKTMENGFMKKVTEPYLVDALSFTEAEARIIKEVTPFMSGEFTVSGVSRENVSEFYYDECGDKWFKCKVMFTTLDERSGAEKKIASFMYVQAIDFETALGNLKKLMKGSMADYSVATISETQIMDVYKYEPAEVKEEEKEN